MIPILYLFGLTLWSTQHTCTCNSNTALASKQGAENHSIAIGVNTYVDLIKKSTVFVDNTLFIDEFLNSQCKSEVMLGPRKWGKTMLMDMLKTFLEIEVNDKGALPYSPRVTAAYGLFKKGEITFKDGPAEKLEKPLLIAEKKIIINKYLGQHPVIYASFKDAVGRNFAEIVERLRIKISNVFVQHRYMLYVLQKEKLTEDVEHFERLLYANATSSISEFASSLSFLCKVLYNHFKKRVFVLIDDYDAPFQSLLHLGEVNKCIVGDLQDIFNSLITHTLSDNENLERGLISGVFRVENNGIDFKNYFRYHSITFKNRTLLQYFGFSETDVELLFDKFNVTGPLAKKARNWYYGHRSLLNNENFYNPWSIVNFLNKKKINNYWLENENLDFLRVPISRSCSLRKHLLYLISNQAIQCKSNMRMNKFQIRSVKNTFQNKSANPEKKGNVYFVFWYLLESGFLVKNRDRVDELARLPNKEFASLIAIRLMSFYQQQYHIDQELVHKTAILLYQYLKDTLEFPHINTTLEAFYKNNRNFAEYDTLNGTMEGPVYAMFTLLLLQVQCITKFDYQVYYDRIKKANYVIYDSITAHGAIVEITIDNVTAQNALIRAEKYRYVFDNFPGDLKTIKCIGINFQSNGTIDVEGSMKKKFVKRNTTTTNFNVTSTIGNFSTMLNSSSTTPNS